MGCCKRQGDGDLERAGGKGGGVGGGKERGQGGPLTSFRILVVEITTCAAV